MKKAAAKPTTKGDNSTADWDGMVVAMQLLDTTWRVALPILLLSYGGVRLDRHLHTAPLFTLIGFFVSLPVVVVLVYKQVKSAYPDFFNSIKGKK